MPALHTATETYVSQPHNDYNTIALVVATICLIWYIAVALVSITGFTQIWRFYSRPPPAPETTTSLGNKPHVTIIRPIKGLDPSLYDCLASTFRQSYPKENLHVRFCISSRAEPSLPVLSRLVNDFSNHDVEILVEDEDEALETGQLQLGPNPKIRNMSRAYREARKGKEDVIWVVDCNVWVGLYACARMVETLQRYKFVHQLPLVVDTTSSLSNEETKALLDNDGDLLASNSADRPVTLSGRNERNWWSIGGGRLEEIFMSSAHAKFYTAINTVLIAPCIVGKSTMFRPAHLDSLTNGLGINYFSENICEDHLIGDLLWKQQVPEEKSGSHLGKHAMSFGDLAVQPMSNMSVGEYWSRRVRWLRVRKFTVTMATLVEPGTECLLCSLYGAFAISTLPFFHNWLHIPHSWPGFFAIFSLSVTCWCVMDWTLYQKLHSGSSITLDERTPGFVRPRGNDKRAFQEWLFAWMGREVLALPIWMWAFWGGTKVEWRGRKFWVGMDMKVHEIEQTGNLRQQSTTPPNGKARLD